MRGSRASQQQPLPCPRHLESPSSHRPSALLGPEHNSALGGRKPQHQPLVHRSHRCPCPQTHARRLTAGKGFKDHGAQPLHIPEEKTGPEREGSGAERGSPTDSAGLRLCPAPVPLPEATSAATPRLPSCSTPLVPTPANSPLWQLPPTLWKEKMARVGSLPLHFPPLISSQLLLPSRYSK